MKKMLKIMAMLLVIATVIFAAGCAEKKEGAGAENKTSVEEANVSTAAVNATGNVSENVTENVSVVNETKNVTVVNETKDVTAADATPEENPTEETKE